MSFFKFLAVSEAVIFLVEGVGVLISMVVNCIILDEIFFPR